MPRSLVPSERVLLSVPQSSPKLRGVLLYPQSYAVGMSSLATHTLYALLNDSEMRWERAFVEPVRGGPGGRSVRSLESGARLAEFDVIAVTSSYELDWPLIPEALEGGGVPALRRERREGPLVLAGGPAVSAAPLPLSLVYDAAYMGEIEPALAELKTALLAPSRAEVLEQLAAVRGVYVPAKHLELAAGALPRRCASDLDEFDTTSVMLSPQAEFADRFLIEIGRGCGRGCRFCLARRLYRPLRWRSPQRILDAVQRGLEFTNDFGLVAAAVSDHPRLDELCVGLETLSPELKISTSSVRLESASDRFLSLLARAGQRTVTFAPEAGTERLRKTIGKELSEEDVFAAVGRAAQAGLTRVRLYFMVGLPGETGEDREGISDLVRRLARAYPKTGFRVNAGAFSPRPHTPFEFEGLPPLRDLRNWLGALKRGLGGVPRVEVATDSARWAAAQAALSRSDERLGLALARHPADSFAALTAALAAEGLDFESLTAAVEPGTMASWKVVDFSCVD